MLATIAKFETRPARDTAGTSDSEYAVYKRSARTEVEPTLLSAGLFDLVCSSHPDQPVMWLELLHGLVRVVDQGESGALASTVMRSESEDADLIFVCFVELGELFS